MLRTRVQGRYALECISIIFMPTPNLLALGTEQCRLELALKDAHDHRLVLAQVLVPRLVSHHVVLTPLVLHRHVHVGLGLDQVEVLVEPVQQEGQQLLGIMLCFASKLWGMTVNL